MLVLSHRGYHADLPENTLEAFELAVGMGVDGIETDIRLSADGLPILFHDRLSPDGREVDSLSRRELCDAAGYTVPTLDAALEGMPGVLWNLEVKTPRAVEAVKSAVSRFGASRRLLITSFWHDVVEEFSQLPGVECGILVAQRPFRDCSVRDLLPERKRIETIVWDFDMLDPSLIRSSRQSGIRNLVYGAGTVREHLYLRRLGVDGVITDHPEFAAKEARDEQ
jgi:glycerophosphoryl diester phosphodiesterase